MISNRRNDDQVTLFGADEARTAALGIWRTARNGGNDLLRALDDLDLQSPLDLHEEIRTVASNLGTVGDRFLDACRKDLQGDYLDAAD